MTRPTDTTSLSDRARLYDRLPVTPDVDWWCDLAARSPDRRVLELGAGTGRLTLPIARRCAEVVAVDHDPTAIARLQVRAAAGGLPIRAVVADVTRLALRARFGAVFLPVSLLNELPLPAQRAAAVEVAAAHCLPGGQAVFQLLNPLWLLGGGRSRGTIEGVDGTRVELEARHDTTDLASQRARAELHYRFPDGERFVDVLDAAAVFPQELDDLLVRSGFTAPTWSGSDPGSSPLAADDGAWHAVATRR